MSEVVEDVLWQDRMPGKYPWNEWLDGRSWKLTKGEDFHIQPESFRATISVTAKRRGLKVRTKAFDGGMFVQAYKENTQ